MPYEDDKKEETHYNGHIINKEYLRPKQRDEKGTLTSLYYEFVVDKKCLKLLLLWKYS